MTYILTVLAVNLAELLAGALLGTAAAFVILGPRRFRERLRELKP